MKRAGIACVAILAMLTALGACAETTVDAMTFNIRYGTANDGDNSWPLRKHVVAATIDEYDPLVVGLQECLAFQAEYLVEQLPRYRWFGVGRDADAGGEMTAILYQPAKVSALATGHFWLSEQPDEPGSVSWDSSLTRMASYARFRHIESNARFHVINTHFDHRGREARLESARLIAARVAALPENLPFIVMGDFNALAPDSAPFEALTAQRLQDTWEAVDAPVGPATTWSGFRAPAAEATRRIDWILFGGPWSVTHAEVVTYHASGRYPSDHFPVYAKFLLAE